MPAPINAILRPDVRETFEEFDVEAQRSAFIGRSVFPAINLPEKAGHFGRIPIESMLLEPETRRGPRGNYNRSDYEFDQISYACQEHGWEEAIDDDLLLQYEYIFEAPTVAAGRALGIILRAQENRIQSAVFNTTTWTGATLFTDVSDEWDDAANATPIADIDAAKIRVRDNSGLNANAVIMDWEVMKNLRNVVEIVDRIKYSGIDDPKGRRITPLMLAALFDVDFVVVAGMGAIRNSANPGAAATPAAIWDDEYCMVCRVAVTGDLKEPCIGRTINWEKDSEPEGIMETYREDQTRADIMRVRHTVDELTLYAEAGHLLGNITA